MIINYLNRFCYSKKNIFDKKNAFGNNKMETFFKKNRKTV